jgi:endoglucanase
MNPLKSILTRRLGGAGLLTGWLVVPSTAGFAAASVSAVRLNTVGFLPDLPKQASVALPATNFAVIRTDTGQVVFQGKVSAPFTNADTREVLFVADYSAFTQEGTYQLDVPGGGRSPAFRIGRDAYHEAFRTVTRAMYLWRCGTAVSGRHNGQTYAHAACHTNDAWLDYVGGGHVHSNSPGGWHDAGDYNKYVVNAGITVGCLFRAWEDFGPQIRKLKLDLPGAGGTLPEFLAELKWELDWLLTMQSPDGSVYHKVSTRDFGGFVRPEAESTERYFTPWSSAATADFVAMMALAARHFRPYDATFSQRCLAAAEKSDRFLAEHPENHRADLTGFKTGAYQSPDDDDRLWAAVELWEATGNTDHLTDFEKRAANYRPKVEFNFDWGSVRNLAMIAYISSSRPGRDAALVESIRSSLQKTADEMVRVSQAHGYARPLGTAYHWGGNGTVARQALVLQAANRIAPNVDYRRVTQDAASYLFGRNPFGRSFVTGLGHQPPLHPHDRTSGSDDIEAPWPGYLVGGPNPKSTDWHDEQADYRTNEIAINWNGALIYALAALLE